MPPNPLVENNGHGIIEFYFPQQWQACRYDETADPTNSFYRKRLKVGNLSAVDFISAADDESELVLVECKDFRKATPENLPRLSQGQTDDETSASILLKKEGLRVRVVRSKQYLAEEFAKNIRDTVLGLAAASRAADPALAPYGALLAGRRTKLVCVLALELDPQPTWMRGEETRIVSRLKQTVEQQLRFLDNVEVVIHWSRAANPRTAWRIEAK